MPSKEEHIQQAVHNQQLCGVLDKAEYPDWSVTVMFYCALHHVDAVLAKELTGQSQHPKRHGHRGRAMAMLQVLKPLYPDYRLLETRSRMARYEHWRGTRNRPNFTESAVRQLEQNTFIPLVESLKRILK